MACESRLGSPSSQVVLDALVGSLEHPVVLLLPKQDVGLQEILVEGVHARAHTTLLAHPLACLDVHNVACRLGMKHTERERERQRDREKERQRDRERERET